LTTTTTPTTSSPSPATQAIFSTDILQMSIDSFSE
jgi:hypothetical protein